MLIALIMSASASDLEPFRMVRSLELVQDRIAGGDHAALPMQRKLLEMADARLRAMDAAELAEPLNFRAILVYAMSGGNPATVEIVLGKLGADDTNRVLADGVLAYARGQAGRADAALATIDPLGQSPELGSYLALVRGSILAAHDPSTALSLLDRARLLAPGTLVEEAALRRSVALAAELGQAERFLRASAQYVRFYLRSPYAAQFADAFVAGAVMLDGKIGHEAIARIAGLMDAERERVIYLRIARQAVIDGLTPLAAFASAAAEGKQDARAQLYSSLSSVTSATIDEVLGRLAGIDRDELSEKDLRLLDAAHAVAASMTAMPARKAGKAPAGAPAETRPRPAADPAAEASPDAPPRDAQADATDAMMAETRRKLEAIDRLLGEPK